MSDTSDVETQMLIDSLRKEILRQSKELASMARLLNLFADSATVNYPDPVRQQLQHDYTKEWRELRAALTHPTKEAA